MSTTASALAAGWSLTDDTGAELPPAPCVGSGQVLAWSPMLRETCPDCGRTVRTVDRALVAHYPERVAPANAGPTAAPTISLDL